MFFYKKIKYPFNLGTTSYILHCKKNNLIKNVNYLSKYLDIIQLLYFSKNYLSDVLSNEINEQLLNIKNKTNISYIIHLPLDLNLFNENNNLITNSYQIIEQIIIKTKILNVKKFILHIDKFENFTYPIIENKKINYSIFENILINLKNLEEKYNINFIIENISYDLVYYSELLFKYNYQICMDIGHLMLRNQNLQNFIKIFNNKISVIHYHGVKNNKDHQDILKIDSNINNLIISYLKNYKQDVIIEVFNKKDLIKSLNYILKIY